jgi:Uma2 family endonuclease
MAVERLVTAAELEGMEDGNRFELVRGRLVPVTPAGDRHGQAAVILAAELRAFVRERQLGRVRVETGFSLFRNPDTVRGPDVSFVAAGKPGGDRTSNGFIAGAPDLAIEIISPSNTRAQIAEKVSEYLEAGCRLVWVVDTDRRVAHVHRPGAVRRTIDANGHLDAEDVVPGFSYSLRALSEELD